MSWKACKE